MRSTLPTFNEVWQQQLRSRILSTQAACAESKFLIACSGGMDSMLLLQLMSALFPKNIRALYINHQLQELSSSWGDFVRAECDKLAIPCIIVNVDVQQGNLENQARIARYQAFQQHILAHEILVLAHHQQDQAETLLLNLFSGSGVGGLSAMREFDQRDGLQIWRPLLDVSREQIESWIEKDKIAYIQDPTNFDTHYDRAWCRETLWPLLQSRFPKMQHAISRSSYLMQDAASILTDVAAQDLQFCGHATCLNIQKLQQLSQARQRQLLSNWVKGHAQYRPSFAMIERLQNEVLAAKVDAKAALHIGEFYYLRYQQHLYKVAATEYLAQKQILPLSQLQLSLDTPVQVAAGRFVISQQQMGLNPELLQQHLTLSPRVGGEKIHLYGRVGRWPLKKAIQDAQIFPWQRHQIQILSKDDVMLGVFTPKGFWLAESIYCQKNGWQPKLLTDH
jgi:tRNA(Ile)-lysidine synthase